MNSSPRTDLALEAARIFSGGGNGAMNIPGVLYTSEESRGIPVTTVEITDGRGEKALGKPRGRYVTMELGALLRREGDAFSASALTLARLLRGMLSVTENSSILVAGLGNRGITPDSLGPAVLDRLMVTRHLREQLPEHFGHFRPVCAMETGVLGTTGVESSALVRAAVREIEPDAVVAIDALAARGPEHLCRTVQLASSGIVPGSGVGNARQALDRETLGVPVVAVGVPTVVDAAVFTDLPDAAEMFVTPRSIDRDVRDIAKLVAYALNLALHEGLSIEDVDMFLS